MVSPDADRYQRLLFGTPPRRFLRAPIPISRAPIPSAPIPIPRAPLPIQRAPLPIQRERRNFLRAPRLNPRANRSILFSRNNNFLDRRIRQNNEPDG